MVGLTGLLFLLVDIIAGRIVDQRLAQPWRLSADAYQGQAWAPTYWAEQARLEERWVPYSYSAYRPFAGQTIHIDEHGRRRTWTSPSASSDARPLEVAVFGGSTVWGMGVRDDHTLPSELARQLAAAGIAARLTNHGQIAHVSRQQFLVLLAALETGPVPDVAIFYDGWNEVVSALRNGFAGGSFFERDRAREFRLSAQPGNLFAALRGHAGVVRLSRWVEPPQPIPGPATPEKAKALAADVIRRYEENVRLIRDLATARGFVPLFYWQPDLLLKRWPTPWEERMKLRGAAAEFFAEVDRTLTASSELAREPRFRDLSRLLAEVREPCFIDRVHVSEAVNGRVAERMLEDLAPLLAAPAASALALEPGAEIAPEER